VSFFSPRCPFKVLAVAASLGVPHFWSALPAQNPPSVTGSVHGIVTDSTSGLPVIAAEVRLVELHRLERTHADGRFDFPDVPAGRYTITTRRLGYRLLSQSVTVQAGEDLSVVLAVRAAAVELAPSVITGALSERPGEQVLSPTSVLAGASLDRKLDATIAASLESQPGVSVTTLSPATARPVIRGLSGDRIVVLEDGQRPGDLSAMSGDHAVTVDPLTATQIEVVRGPMSLLYGSSALGGVVNVVREEIPRSRPDRVHGTLSAQGTSVNSGGTLGGVANSRLGVWALRGEGSLRTANDTRTPVGKLVNTGVKEYNLSAGASLVRGWGHAGAAYRFYSNDYGIPGGFVGGHPSGVDITMRRHALRAESDVHLTRGPFATVQATATGTDYHHTEFESSGAVGTTFGQSIGAGELTARHDTWGPFALGAVGVRAQYRDITTGGSLRTPSTSDVNLAGYLVEELGRGAVRVQAGARYDWASYSPHEQTFIDVGGVRVPVRDRTFGSVSGSLGILYTPAEGIRLGASLNRAYRTPDFNELYSNGPHLAANSFIVGDPDLSEETGLGVDAFLRVNRGPVNAELAAFRNTLADFIFESSRGRAEIGPQGGRPRFQFTNEAARFSGAEGRMEWSVTTSLVLDATASYVQARFTSRRDSLPVISGTDTTFVAPAKYPPFIPPLNGQIGLRVDRTRWFAGAGARFAARQNRVGDFEDPTAGYIVPNANVGWRAVRGSQLHTVTLRVDNAFDREYRDHLSRIKLIMPEPGRNVSLLYRLTF
jgi:iron complex outermembrane receptor protein